jgi:hypothetical protein
MFSLGICILKNIWQNALIMSQPKELIEIKKLQSLVQAIGYIHKDLERAAKNTQEDGLPGVYMEGWKMMCLGLSQIQKQAAKITGQASKTANLDLSQLAPDGKAKPTVAASDKKLAAKRLGSKSKD